MCVPLLCMQYEIHVMLLLQSLLGCLDGALPTNSLKQQEASQAVGTLPAGQPVEKPSASGSDITGMVRGRCCGCFQLLIFSKLAWMLCLSSASLFQHVPACAPTESRNL